MQSEYTHLTAVEEQSILPIQYLMAWRIAKVLALLMMRGVGFLLRGLAS